MLLSVVSRRLYDSRDMSMNHGHVEKNDDARKPSLVDPLLPGHFRSEVSREKTLCILTRDDGDPFREGREKPSAKSPAHRRDDSSFRDR